MADFDHHSDGYTALNSNFEAAPNQGHETLRRLRNQSLVPHATSMSYGPLNSGEYHLRDHGTQNDDIVQGLDDLDGPKNELDDDSKQNPYSFTSSPFSWCLFSVKMFFIYVYTQLRTMTRRWIIGIVILLVVNFIWASSSMAVQAIFSGFDKPFFLTYFSTSLFTLFLSGFLFMKSWRENDSIAELSRQTVAPKPSETEPLIDESMEKEDYNSENASRRLQHQIYDQETSNNDESHFSASHGFHDSQHSPPEQRFSTNSDLVSSGTKLRSFVEEGSDEDSPLYQRSSSRKPGENATLYIDNDGPIGLLEEKEGLEGETSILPSTDLPSDSLVANSEPIEEKPAHIMTVKQVAFIALQFLPIWFIANVTFNWSLRGTSVTSTSIISTTSSFWTLLFCHFFKVERFTILRTVALLVTLGGVVAVAVSDQKSGKDSWIGDTLSIISAICYGVYASFLRIKIKDEKQVKMPMFFGFVGFFNLVLMWPFFFILHYTKLEIFEIPSVKDTIVLALNGLIGTVLSDLLWSLVIFLTSATVATVGLSLSVPMSLILDLVIKHRKFPVLYYFGACVVLIGFFTASLSQDSTIRERKEQEEREESQEP